MVSREKGYFGQSDMVYGHMIMPMVEKQGQVIVSPTRITWSRAYKLPDRRKADHTKNVAAIYLEDSVISFPPSFPSTLMMCEIKFYKHKLMWSWLTYYKLLLMLSQVSCKNTLGNIYRKILGQNFFILHKSLLSTNLSS